MTKTEALQKFNEQLRLLRRSRNTISTYVGWVEKYIDFITAHPGGTREERIGKFLSRIG